MEQNLDQALGVIFVQVDQEAEKRKQDAGRYADHLREGGDPVHGPKTEFAGRLNNAHRRAEGRAPIPVSPIGPYGGMVESYLMWEFLLDHAGEWMAVPEIIAHVKERKGGNMTIRSQVEATMGGTTSKSDFKLEKESRAGRVHYRLVARTIRKDDRVRTPDGDGVVTSLMGDWNLYVKLDGQAEPVGGSIFSEAEVEKLESPASVG